MFSNANEEIKAWETSIYFLNSRNLSEVTKPGAGVLGTRSSLVHRPAHPTLRTPVCLRIRADSHSCRGLRKAEIAALCRCCLRSSRG